MPRKPVNIIITGLYHTVAPRPLGEKHIEQIKTVSPRIQIFEIGEMAYNDLHSDSSVNPKLDEILAQADILYGFLPKNIVARAPNLKWVQAPIAGVDSYFIPEIVKSDIILTNARGIHGTQVGELAITLALMLAKKAPLFTRLKQEKIWGNFMPDLFYHKTMAILGLGPIGTWIAKTAKAFEIKVIGYEASKMDKPKFIDEIYPPGKLKEVLAQADFVVIALPYTHQTDKLIGEAELKAMKPTAYLINIARGGIIDESVLIKALKENWIAGAGLDAFTVEPLPPTSPLWYLPNVIITPHRGGHRVDYDDMAINLFSKNIKRFLSGKELINIVDKKRDF